MRDLVDGEEQVLVRGGPDHVCGKKKFPREHRGIAKQISAANLKRDDGENKVFREWFRTT
jgi:hypothetical protein